MRFIDSKYTLFIALLLPLEIFASGISREAANIAVHLAIIVLLFLIHTMYLVFSWRRSNYGKQFLTISLSLSTLSSILALSMSSPSMADKDALAAWLAIYSAPVAYGLFSLTKYRNS